MALEGTVAGAAGRRDAIVRIWDTGASQGMNDITVTPPKIFEGPLISIQTGQGIARLKHWVLAPICPGIDM